MSTHMDGQWTTRHASMADERRVGEDYTAEAVRMLIGDNCYEEAVNTLLYLEELYRLSSKVVDSLFTLIVQADDQAG